MRLCGYSIASNLIAKTEAQGGRLKCKEYASGIAPTVAAQRRLATVIPSVRLIERPTARRDRGERPPSSGRPGPGAAWTSRCGAGHANPKLLSRNSGLPAALAGCNRDRGCASSAACAWEVVRLRVVAAIEAGSVCTYWQAAEVFGV